MTHTIISNFIVEASENLRVLTLPNGNKINFKRNDPYGLWTVHYEKGAMPECLCGEYTSFLKARDAVFHYLAENKKLEKTEENASVPTGRNRKQLSASPDH